ncbi:HEAT repeat domain-containing protein [Nibribacter ruber]|uniref:HEAT repeat domain-containing protein n=1 Tax=Nibribacter ruber TaxID=2698458 RepID=A0A6P1P0L1_9BACT|nr:HEAT repeat domain-containing protein [Nibribacter ruber]QHL87908.1 HEAT repeat domain-containing protein [Nibribacter ruber]
MQFNQIEALLEKYYNGQTSLPEEAQLREFFLKTKLLPDHLKAHAAAFQFYAHEQTVEMDKFLADDWLFAKIEQPSMAAEPATPTTRNVFTAYSWQIAASITLLLVAFWAGSYFKPASQLTSGTAPLATQQEKAETPAPPAEEVAPVIEEPALASAKSAPIEPEPAAETQARASKARPRKGIVLASNVTQVASASDRLQLISQEMPAQGLTPQENQKVMRLLIKTMQQDDNVNVRLAACEALYQFKDQKEARQAFIQALGTQTDPMMQLTLIDIVISLKEKRALPQLQQLANQENVLPIIKHKAQEGLGTLI